MTEPVPERSTADADERFVRDLLRLAGRRQDPPVDSARRVRAAVEAEWRDSLVRRRRRRLWMATVAAAGVAAAIGVAVAPSFRAPAAVPATSAPVTIATVDRTDGEVRNTTTDATPLSVGSAVTTGSTVATGASGRAALSTTTGTALRLDHMTQVTFEAVQRVRLDRGRIYVDTRGLAAPISIVVPSGVVRDIGTQFEVGVADDESMTVRVREGTALVDRPGGRWNVSAAEALRISPSGAVERLTIPTSGPDWAWVTTIAPSFVVENAPLDRYLDWVARELGVRWQFASAGDAQAGAGVVLHGTIDGLTPAESLDAVLPTCGMTHETRNGTLIIRRAGEKGD